MASYPDLAGKVFLITGAASGMGREISYLLAKQKAKVALLDMKSPQATLAEVKKLGGEGLALEVDVVSSSDVENAVKKVVDHFGRLDGAANMAGILGAPSVTHRMSDQEWDRMIAVNVTGVRNCIVSEVKHIAGAGSIVSAASIAGQSACPGFGHYGVSKWGVIGLTKAAAHEYGRRNIRINAVAPGVVATELLGSAENHAALLQSQRDTIALRRLAKPEELARVIVFMLSDEASYMTGSVVNVDGGWPVNNQVTDADVSATNGA